MSAIEFQKYWRVRCRNCNETILEDLSSKEGAKDLAASHINDVDLGEAYPNYNCVVEITSYTLAGRNI